MRKKLSMLVAAGLLSLSTAVSAATISGQIDIVGVVNLNTSSFTATGNGDLDPTGVVLIATGDFSTVGFLSVANLTDISFPAPGQIWSVGGFTFTATSFSGFLNMATTKAFTALGIVTGLGFDATDGILSFSAQGSKGKVSFSSTTVAPIPVPAAGFLLIGALGGLALLSRRRKTA